MDITRGQIDAYSHAYEGHPDLENIMKVVRTLTKDAGIKLIGSFHGATYYMAKGNPNETIRKHAKERLQAGIDALKLYGYDKKCSLCRQPLTTCCC